MEEQIPAADQSNFLSKKEFKYNKL